MRSHFEAAMELDEAGVAGDVVVPVTGKCAAALLAKGAVQLCLDALQAASGGKINLRWPNVKCAANVVRKRIALPGHAGQVRRRWVVTLQSPLRTEMVCCHEAPRWL